MPVNLPDPKKEKNAVQNERRQLTCSSMTSRERILKAIRHEETDRLPIDLGGMASTGIMAIAYARLKEHLGIKTGEIRLFDIGQQLAEIEPEILSRFGVDVISLENSLGETPSEFWKPWKLPNGTTCQVPASVDLRPDTENGGWLIWENEIPTQRMSASSLYFSEIFHPLAEITTSEELKLFPRPVISEEDLKFLEMRAKALYENTDFAIIANYGGSILEAGHSLRGFTRFTMDLAKELFALSKDFIKDKTFVIFMIAFFFIQAGTSNYFSGYLYYMDNVLEVSGLKATIPDLLTGILQMALFPLIVLMVRKFGSKEILWKGLLIAVVGHAVLTLPINYWIAAGTYLVILAGYGFASAINNPIAGLVVDHLELETNKRQPGVVRGIMAILLIPAASLQPLILSTLLSAAGYVGESKSQTAEVVQAIRYGAGIIPAVILLIGILLLIRLPINHEKELEIQAVIEEKHGKRLEAGNLS